MTRLLSYTAILAVLVLFAGVNIIAGRLLEGNAAATIDLTADNLYTLSDASKEIARAPEEPIDLTLYYSEELAQGLPDLERFGRRVEETVAAFAAASRGKIDLTVIDPEPFSEDEDAAFDAGLRGIPIGEGGEQFYLGLVGANATTGREIIPFFRPQADAERFLEYDVAELIYELSEPDRPTLALYSGIDLSGGAPSPQARQRPEPWLIRDELAAAVDIIDLDTSFADIPEEADALLVFHPKNLPDESRYAIDQWVLDGGNAAFVVDPLAESDRDDPNPQMAQFGMPGTPTSSDLPNLFESWGVRVRPRVVAGDALAALQVPDQGPRATGNVPFLPFISVAEDRLAQDDPITGRLSELIVATGGIIDPLPEADPAGPDLGEQADPADNVPPSSVASMTVEPLVTTTDEGGEIDTSSLMFQAQPRQLIAGFNPEGVLTLAARVTGSARTAFPNGPPPGIDNRDDEAPRVETPDPDADETTETDSGEAPERPADAHRTEGDINVVIIADADMFSNRFWIRQIPFGGTNLVQRISDNGAFLASAVATMAGSDALAALRGRAGGDRPLTTIEQMQAEADLALIEKQESIEEEIAQAERRLNDLLTRADVDPDSLSTRLPDEVEAEIDRLQTRIQELGRERRDIRQELNRDIDRLQTRLTLINVALVPAALFIFAIGLSLTRSIRRRVDRRRGLGAG